MARCSFHIYIKMICLKIFNEFIIAELRKFVNESKSETVSVTSPVLKRTAKDTMFFYWDTPNHIKRCSLLFKKK